MAFLYFNFWLITTRTVILNDVKFAFLGGFVWVVSLFHPVFRFRYFIFDARFEPYMRRFFIVCALIVFIKIAVTEFRLLAVLMGFGITLNISCIFFFFLIL